MKIKSISLFALLASGLILASCATANPSTSVSNNTSNNPTSQTSEQRVFTLTELAEYNGDNGSDAYIGFEGTVYDVTDADGWENGWHKGQHLAGTDITEIFADSPHSASIFTNLPIMGILE